MFCYPNQIHIITLKRYDRILKSAIDASHRYLPQDIIFNPN